MGEVWGTPNGQKLKVTKTLANGTPQDEEADGFFLSGDKNFRPTDAIFGEDGALYVADWQNVIIGHMQHNVRDPNRDHKHGRIFRVSYTKKPLQKKVAIEGQPIEKLLENLKHPVDGVRHRTRVELSGRDTNEVISATQKRKRTPIICWKRFGYINSTTGGTDACSTICSSLPNRTHAWRR